MSFLVLLLIAVLIYGTLKTNFSILRSRGAQERSAAIRFAAFSWILGIMMVALLFLPVPGKHRILMLAPLFFIGVGVRKVLRNARERIRREEQLDVDIERMKRVN